MDKSITEREINIWDMLWAVCLKWRSICVCAIIFAVLAGGFSYYKSAQAVSTEAPEQKSEELALVLTADEKNAADVYCNYAEAYKNQELYNKNSLIMQLNANNFYRGEVSYYVDNYFEVEYPAISKTNNVSAMISSYTAVLNTEQFEEKLNTLLSEEISAAYGMELVDSENKYGENAAVKSVPESGIFTVSVYADSEELCNELKELVKEELQAHKSDVERRIGEHEITLIQDACHLMADAELLAYQTDNAGKLQIISTHMSNLKSKFNDQQKAYVSLIEKESADVAEKDEAPIVTSEPAISKKIVVLGFLAGAFVAFALWGLLYMINGKVRLEDDFEMVYNTKLLGNIQTAAKKKKKWFGFIDKMFIALRHYNKRYFEQDKAYEMTAANIRISLKNSENKTLLVSGAICGDEEKAVVEELAKRLKQDGITIVFTNPVLYNAEALEKLVEIGQVVFVEKAEKSLYQEVLREVEICKQQKINLLGCVVIY